MKHSAIPACFRSENRDRASRAATVRFDPPPLINLARGSPRTPIPRSCGNPAWTPMSMPGRLIRPTDRARPAAHSAHASAYRAAADLRRLVVVDSDWSCSVRLPLCMQIAEFAYPAYLLMPRLTNRGDRFCGNDFAMKVDSRQPLCRDVPTLSCTLVSSTLWTRRLGVECQTLRLRTPSAGRLDAA